MQDCVDADHDVDFIDRDVLVTYQDGSQEMTEKPHYRCWDCDKNFSVREGRKVRGF